MTYLSPDQMRPALLSEVRSPGILLQTSKYSAPFLVIGDEDDADVICLDGDHKFQSFKRSGAQGWAGLAIEGIEFEIDPETAIDLVGFRKIPGLIIRKGSLLSITAMSDNAFRQTIAIPVLSSLPEGSLNQEVAFTRWRVLVTVGKERRIVREFSMPLDES
jgi:hypothetical protein